METLVQETGIPQKARFDEGYRIKMADARGKRHALKLNVTDEGESLRVFDAGQCRRIRLRGILLSKNRFVVFASERVWQWRG